MIAAFKGSFLNPRVQRPFSMIVDEMADETANIRVDQHKVQGSKPTKVSSGDIGW
jgi:hypothetical protein